ncbi:MAG: hypothetical protein IAF08_14320 [Rhizobacter sp.]|nr:hypothetical protein [Chlorobiales bacterium]
MFSAVVPGNTLLPVKFGSLVRTSQGAMDIFAVVSFIEHAPTESNRKVSPHGKTKEVLRREMPQVFELLQTEFHAIVLGYRNTGDTRLYQATPPLPPDLHEFVYAATAEEQTSFFSMRTAYIRTLLSNRDMNPDELIAAFLRNHLGLAAMSEHLVAAGKDLSHLLSDDHRRLESIFERILE